MLQTRQQQWNLEPSVRIRDPVSWGALWSPQLVSDMNWYCVPLHRQERQMQAGKDAIWFQRVADKAQQQNSTRLLGCQSPGIDWRKSHPITVDPWHTRGSSAEKYKLWPPRLWPSGHQNPVLALNGKFWKLPSGLQPKELSWPSGTRQGSLGLWGDKGAPSIPWPVCKRTQRRGAEGAVQGPEELNAARVWEGPWTFPSQGCHSKWERVIDTIMLRRSRHPEHLQWKTRGQDQPQTQHKLLYRLGSVI